MPVCITTSLSFRPSLSHPGALSRYVESRVRKLADNLSYLPLCRIRLLPKKLPLLTVGGHEGVSYLVGFDVDRERLRGDELHMTNQVEAFREEVVHGALRSGVATEATVERYRLKFASFASWRDLPDAACELVGGRAAARALRKRLVEARRAEAAARGEMLPGEQRRALAQAQAQAAAGADATDAGEAAASSGSASAGAGEKRLLAGESEANAPPAKAARAADDQAVPQLPIQAGVHELQDEESQLATAAPRALGSGRARVALCLE